METDRERGARWYLASNFIAPWMLRRGEAADEALRLAGLYAKQCDATAASDALLREKYDMVNRLTLEANGLRLKIHELESRLDELDDRPDN